MITTPSPRSDQTAPRAQAGERARDADSVAHVRRFAFVTMLMVAAGVWFVSPASAITDDDMSWGVRTADTEQGEGRANFSYAVEPGEVITDAVMVTNQGDEDLTIEISTADGYTTPEATLAFEGPEVAPVGVGAWITPREDDVTLRPGEGREVEFTLTVPVDAAPGDHAGGIFTVSSTVDDSNIQINRRLGLRVHVRVSGEQVIDLHVSELTYRHTASLNPFAAGIALVTYTVRNDGSVRTYFTEDVTVAAVGGSSSQHRSAVVEEILPGSEIARTVEVEAWPLFRSTVEVRVVPTAIDGTVGADEVRTASGWAVPWTALAILAALLGAAVTVGVLRARRGEAALPG